MRPIWRSDRRLMAAGAPIWPSCFVLRNFGILGAHKRRYPSIKGIPAPRTPSPTHTAGVKTYGTTCPSLHCVPVKLVLGDAPAAPQPHPGHTLRPRRLVERCVGLPPRLPTALRRRLPGGQLAGSQALKGEKERPRARQPSLSSYTARRCWASYSTSARAHGLTGWLGTDSAISPAPRRPSRGRRRRPRRRASTRAAAG